MVWGSIIGGAIGGGATVYFLDKMNIKKKKKRRRTQ